MQNPFEYGRELGADELVDRQEEIAAVVSAIKHGGKLFLIGPRRYGKTSILRAASDTAQAEHRAIILRSNAEGFPTLDEMVSRIVTDAARELQGGLERTAEKVKDYFARLRPEFSVNATQTQWTVKVGAGLLKEGFDTQVTLLIDALDGLEELARKEAGGRPVALIIDEFQKVIERGGRETEGQLRAAVQQHRRTGYVFAGSQTRMLTEMTGDASRPFYRLGSSLFIGPVPRDDFYRFLTGKFARGGFAIRGRKERPPGRAESETSPVDLILDLAEEVPYNVQALAHACWEQLAGAKSEAGRVLTGRVVGDALERLVRRYDPMFTQQWIQLTAVQQKTLIAVIEEGGRQMQSMKVSRKIGKGTATVRKALEALMARNILREEETLGESRYRFEDPFFARWVRLIVRREAGG